MRPLAEPCPQHSNPALSSLGGVFRFRPRASASSDTLHCTQADSAGHLPSNLRQSASTRPARGHGTGADPAGGGQTPALGDVVMSSAAISPAALMRRAREVHMLKKLPPRITPLVKPTSGWDQEGRPSASERGYGWAWKKLRDRIMVRDHGLCQPCKRRGLVTLAREVDHILGKDQGGDDSPANLQAICLPCHKAKTAAESFGGEWDGEPLTEPR